ncbi:hypothetical protein F4778DRAFT_775432 [Xylariomycetidae sp. FL2044]|nr:hypothetical protein F4778DRAFT_775432 [Xylariomycetidae sp. FL2044]
MTYGEKPEAEPSSNPKIAAYKLSFIKGGMGFMMHNHHYANDFNGWSNHMHQLAENCVTIWKTPDDPDYPPWDPANLDYSAIRCPCPAPERLVDGPPKSQPHPGHLPCQFLLFHLPKSKAAELKKLASPEDGSFWISLPTTRVAHISGACSRNTGLSTSDRIPQPSSSEENILYMPLSMQNPTPQPTAADVISEAPLSKLAWYNRQPTNSTTQENLENMLDQIAMVRDKTPLSLRMDSFPPLSNIVTDWRMSNPYQPDFGFGTPYAFRHPFGDVPPGYIIIYPTRINGGPAGPDEGVELLISFEKELIPNLMADPELIRFFEFRGVDA